MAATMVVALASRMAENALEKPASTAARGDLPLRSSSRTRSKMSTLASTAMPRVRMMPAIPGKVRDRQDTHDNDEIEPQSNRRNETREAIVYQQKHDNQAASQYCCTHPFND